MLFGQEWALRKSPAGTRQWVPVDVEEQHKVPTGHKAANKFTTIMATTDIAMRMDPAHAEISKRFHNNPDQFTETFYPSLA